MYKLDVNHKEIVITLQQLGCLIIDNAKVKRDEPGQLDIWCGITDNQTNSAIWVWIEIKTLTGNPSPSQIRTIQECNDRQLPVEIIRTVEDCVKLVRKYTDNVR